MPATTTSVLTYAVESWESYWHDAEPLWYAHWREVALDQHVIPLDVDLARYAALDAAGQLHIVTARDGDGTLRGYALFIVHSHLHYQRTRHAFLDVYFVEPQYRRGLAGYRLFKTVEATLKARDCQKMILGRKLHILPKLDRFFLRLGYTAIETVYSKLL